jgi:hypothetical protein
MNDHFQHQMALKLADTTDSVCFMQTNINWLVFVMRVECVFSEGLGNCSIMRVPHMCSSMGR